MSSRCALWIYALVFTLALVTRARASASDDETGNPAAAEPSSRAAAEPTVAVEVPPATPRRPLVSGAALEVLQMHQTGVAQEVMLSYIQEAGRTFYLQARDIIELTQAGVPSPLIVAMIRQGRAAASPPLAAAPKALATTVEVASTVEVGRAEVTETPVAVPAAVPVSTEPIFVTVSRKREYVPFVPPWVTGIGHYPYSYYPSAREKYWRRAYEDRVGYHPYARCPLPPECVRPCLGD